MINQVKYAKRTPTDFARAMAQQPVIVSGSPPIALSGGDPAVGRWIVEQGLTGESLASLIEGACEQLVAAGLPIWRAYLVMPTIDPDQQAISLRWQRGKRGIERKAVGHDSEPQFFQESPFWALIQQGKSSARWQLGFDATPTAFPILEKLRAQGATDYLAQVITFDFTEKLALRGCAISFATDHASGFSDRDVTCLSAITPMLGLAAYRFGTSDLLIEMLGCYVGQDAGRRVLRGEIRRGIGHPLSAALLFADLRGFTTVAETSGKGLIARLGHHLAAMAEPVEAHGGEVLKFLGDGLLAAFPIVDSDRPEEACAAAFAAAFDALDSNAAVNARYREEPPLLLDISLHRGEVFYGNVGAGRRLDFTVIGPAVNEASRIETMCGVLDQPLLMSEQFALCCGHPVVSLGRYDLRGVMSKRELFCPA